MQRISCTPFLREVRFDISGVSIMSMASIFRALKDRPVACYSHSLCYLAYFSHWSVLMVRFYSRLYVPCLRYSSCSTSINKCSRYYYGACKPQQLCITLDDYLFHTPPQHFILMDESSKVTVNRRKRSGQRMRLIFCNTVEWYEKLRSQLRKS